MRQVRGIWLRNAAACLRWSRVFAYVAVAVAGWVALFNPPASVQAASRGELVVLVWAGLLGLAATICAVGAISDRWVGEYVGLVPMALSAAAFAVSALSRGTAGIAGGAFLIGFFWFLAHRWQEVALLRIESDRHARQRNQNNGENR